MYEGPGLKELLRGASKARPGEEGKLRMKLEAGEALVGEKVEELAFQAGSQNPL